MDVEILPAIHLATLKLTTRIHQGTGKRQILTGDVLDVLRKQLPADAFCILAITMTDLYPEPDWNYVFGQASLRGRVGVYSFARYDPAFFGERRTKDYERILLRRSCKVLVHETAHMFGMKHCIYYTCAINGSNHLRESDSRPLHLCPVCLRKLQHSAKFDVVKRYTKLREYYKKADFDDAAEWLTGRLEHIKSADS
jgi:archaemetzincin